MNKNTVSIVKYEKPLESVRRVIELCRGLEGVKPGDKVFIKPNIVFWTALVPFPKWGVITTSRVIEDLVVLLKEKGVDDITIGEGVVTQKPKDFRTTAHAFEYLGYRKLEARYGVGIINVFERPFETVELGEGSTLNFNTDILSSDLVIDVPVLKTHAQTVVSLGIKNLKGTIDIESRKKCHAADPVKNLLYMIARLPDKLPPILTVLDGIYTLERGPAFDGRAKRSNLLVAGTDILSTDLVGARILGHDPAGITYLVNAAQNRNRPADLSDVEIVGEDLESSITPHQYNFVYNEDGSLPIQMEKMGIKGVTYKKYDLTMCTYCSALNGVALASIAMAWKGEPFDDVEVLTGKEMQPTPGRKKTILLGKCMYDIHKDNPVINELYAIKSCPPQPKSVAKALIAAGIPVDPQIFENIEMSPGFFYEPLQG